MTTMRTASWLEISDREKRIEGEQVGKIERSLNDDGSKSRTVGQTSR